MTLTVERLMAMLAGLPGSMEVRVRTLDAELPLSPIVTTYAPKDSVRTRALLWQQDA